MKSSFRAMIASLLILSALVISSCGGGGSGSGGSGAVDSQLRDDNNWQVIQTSDQ